MSRHDIDFVALDLAFKHDSGTPVDNSLSKLLDHLLNIAAVHAKLLGDLQG